ncbi:Chaperone protein DnaJ [Hartmannibacter diazotrophicus]|uniref:Chaperone protein DnaJ n=1 Tax=Hartmannibacter diazotrophicus TaxID=1482074 RepID=A0A2C9D208_9HYPH|nr:J domain-containing protein [Hartmannibacter diazotrophicus]SON54280.1 Chaperone protein DnaJ [Hartmannibacter diazotrophicus]
MRNLYDVLGISRDATTEDIQKAKRRLARATHPDVAGGSKEAFQAVEEAARVLGDPETRLLYDATGHTPHDGLDEAAEGIVWAEVGKAMMSSDKPERLDIVGLARNSISDTIQTARSNIKKLTAAKVNAARMAGRFRTSLPNDPIAQRFAKIQRDADAEIESTKAKIKVFERALQIAEAYEFEREPTPSATACDGWVFVQTPRTW